MKTLEMPQLGMGTWELKGKECTDVVSLALDLGYRHIDTAHVYDNHRAIGKAIARFDRGALFLTSKFTLNMVDFSNVRASVEKTCDNALKTLGCEYLDLYLIHWPNHVLDMAKVFQAMQGLVRKGKILRAGVSNFGIRHLEDLRKKKYIPYANQVEFHPYLYQKELLKYCHSHRIECVAYRPLGKKKLLKEQLFKRIAEKHGKSAAQIILRWCIQKKCTVIPKSSSKTHLMENLEIFDFSLSAAEMKLLDALHRNKRFCGENDPEFDY